MTRLSSSQQVREALLDGTELEAVTLARLCQRASGILHAASVAMLLTTDDLSAVTAASDADAVRAADVQAMLGEGPTIEAQAAHLPVVTTDLAHDERWPQLAAVAEELGSGPVIAVPLLDESHQLGVLTVYDGRADQLGGPALTQVVHLARVLTGVILSLPIDEAAGTGLAAAVTAAADVQSRIHQAAGIISVDQGCSLEEALVRMRAHAYSHDLLVSEVATAVLEGRSRLR